MSVCLRVYRNPIIASIAECGDCRHYTAGQTVLSMGQYDGAEFFVVTSGKMKVTVIDPESGSMMIEEFNQNDVFAMEFAFRSKSEGVAQQFSVTAEDDLSIIAIDMESFKSLSGQRPSLMRNVAGYLADELSARRFKGVAAEAAPQQRVFSALMKFVERDRVTNAWRIPQMPKHRELAEHAGVEEADAAAAVALLIQEGVASRDYPGMIVQDMTRLSELAGQG